MADEAEVIAIQPADAEPGAQAPRTLQLPSGRAVTVHADTHGERLEITETSAQLSLQVRLTDQGPLIVAEGAALELHGAESIALRARTVTIAAEERAQLSSAGELQVESKEELRIRSDDAVRVNGEMIYLN